MLDNEQSQCVFAQSKHPIMAVIHLYSLTGQKEATTIVIVLEQMTTRPF